MSDKGRVYYCAWEKAQDGSYAGWEKKHPSLRAVALTKLDLVNRLTDIVGEYHNDHEAALEFDPPLSSGEGNDEFFSDGFVRLRWNTLFTFRPSRESAYAGGRCKRCGGGIGPRTSVPLVVDSPLEGADGAICTPSNEPPPSHGEPGTLIIVSEAFLRLLTDAERGQFEARPVEWSQRPRQKFFEIIPRSFMPAVVIKGLEFGGWRCGSCGRLRYSHGTTLGWGVDVICRSDLRSPTLPCFFVGDPIDVSFCMSSKRWNEVLGKSGTGKLTSERVAVVSEAKCERHPWLPTFEEIAEFRHKHNLERWAPIVATGKSGVLRGYSKDLKSYVEGTCSQMEQ